MTRKHSPLRLLATLMLAWLALFPLAMFFRPLPRSRHPQRRTREECAAQAAEAGRKGRSAQPMDAEGRILRYRLQRTPFYRHEHDDGAGPVALTPAQRRRAAKKARSNGEAVPAAAESDGAA